MSRDLYSNNNDFLSEDIEQTVSCEFKKYKKYKKSKKKKKKNQKKLKKKQMKKLEKRIAKKLEKKYRKKYKKCKQSLLIDFFEKNMNQFFGEVKAPKVLQSLNNIYKADENKEYI